jgi:hypothetical protein
MKNITFSLLLLCVVHLDLKAQGGATLHVFPQVADGVGGSAAFLSSLAVINVSNQAANCTYRLYGGVANRISGPSTFTLGSLGTPILINTVLADGTNLPLATGYGTLTCSQPVTATVSYVYLAVPSGTVIAGAAVFSSPPAKQAELVAYQTAGYRTALAIANDTDTAAQYQVTVYFGNGGGRQIGPANVSVPARSNLATFLDEIMTFPSDFNVGAVVVSGSTPFSTVGLVFNGSVFFSEPAAVLVP